jgi:hypothetical protein
LKRDVWAFLFVGAALDIGSQDWHVAWGVVDGAVAVVERFPSATILHLRAGHRRLRIGESECVHQSVSVVIRRNKFVFTWMKKN